MTIIEATRTELAAARRTLTDWADRLQQAGADGADALRRCAANRAPHAFAPAIEDAQEIAVWAARDLCATPACADGDEACDACERDRAALEGAVITFQLAAEARERRALERHALAGLFPAGRSS